MVDEKSDDGASIGHLKKKQVTSPASGEGKRKKTGINASNLIATTETDNLIHPTLEGYTSRMGNNPFVLEKAKETLRGDALTTEHLSIPLQFMTNRSTINGQSDQKKSFIELDTDRDVDCENVLD